MKQPQADVDEGVEIVGHIDIGVYRNAPLLLNLHHWLPARLLPCKVSQREIVVFLCHVNWCGKGP